MKKGSKFRVDGIQPMTKLTRGNGEVKAKGTKKTSSAENGQEGRGGGGRSGGVPDGEIEIWEITTGSGSAKNQQ